MANIYFRLFCLIPTFLKFVFKIYSETTSVGVAKH